MRFTFVKTHTFYGIVVICQILCKYIILTIIAAPLFAGCISQGTLLDRSEILQKPYKKWTEEECRLIMKDFASTNILNRAAPLYIVVIPCTPNYLLAYNCYQWKKHLCSWDEFLENTDRQARNCFGGSFDSRTGAFINGNGMYIRDISQVDSLLITIDIENPNDIKNLTALLSIPALGWWIGSSFSFDLFPDVSQMEDKISFREGNVIIARPEYVRGGKASFLMKEEQYAAMFYIDTNFKQYIREHETVDLYFNLGNSSVVIPVRFSI